jgi:hypothetical protein
MKIGIDFDNTIACYDGVFHQAALERGLIPADLPSSKNSVRDFLNQNDRKEEFTKLQGYVYGSRMDLVKFYPGFTEFFSKAISKGHDLFIISHKTRFPIAGPRYDMHAAAMQCLDDHGLFSKAGFLRESVFFEVTKENKITRANAVSVDVFIDDLPEILSMPGFPDGCRRILFDPYSHHDDVHTFERSAHWHDVKGILL